MHKEAIQDNYPNTVTAIPIAILHRNEFESLFKMIESILLNTHHPYRIFVVDNNSSTIDKAEQIQRIKKIKEVTLIESKKNNWALGFNNAIKHPEWPKDAEYIVLSDSDIVVPAIVNNTTCWLTHLKEQMNAHACIGKLGISLQWDDIDNPTIKENVIKQETQFQKNPKIGENIIAPVDTTLAIYRTDFFVFREFFFSIGHASLARPHYYTCRTSGKLRAKHLGWYASTALKPDALALREKVRCFAKYSGHIDANVLDACDALSRYYYKIIHPLSLIFWGLRVITHNFLYITKRFPRKINEIQAKCR